MKKHYFQVFLLLCCLTAMLASPVYSQGCSYIAYANSPVCVGGTISLSSSAPPQGAHRWRGPGNYSSNLAAPNIPATAARSGVYTLSVTYNACVATATVSVVVNSPITSLSASSNSPSAQVSHGGTLNLASSGSPGGGSYYWSGPGFSSGSQNPSRSPADANNHSGTYYVTYSIPGCPEWTASTSVSIRHTCTVTATSNGPVCGGGSESDGPPTTINLSASGNGSSTANSTFRWAGPNGFSDSVQNPSIGDPEAYNSGIYTVTIRKNNSQCTNTATVSVQVNTVSISYLSTNSPVCRGGTIELSASGSGSGPGDGQYYFEDFYNGTYSTGWTSANTASFSNAQSDDFFLVTFKKNGCTTYDFSYVVVKGIVASANPEYNVFVGTTVQLNANDYEGGTDKQFAWSGPGGFTSTKQNPSVKVTNLGYNYYTVTATIDECITSDYTYVHATNQLVVCQSYISACVGSSISLCSNMIPLGAHKWKGPAGSNFASNLANPTINNLKLTNSGTYSLSVTYNAKVYTATVYVDVYDCSKSTRMATADDATAIDMNINAYPNPVTNTLKVEVELKEAGPLSLQLFNSMGQPSGTWQLNNETTVHKTELDMTSLQGGVYLLQAQSGKEKAVKRVVKIQY